MYPFLPSEPTTGIRSVGSTDGQEGAVLRSWRAFQRHFKSRFGSHQHTTYQLLASPERPHSSEVTYYSLSHYSS